MSARQEELKAWGESAEEKYQPEDEKSPVQSRSALPFPTCALSSETPKHCVLQFPRLSNEAHLSVLT